MDLNLESLIQEIDEIIILNCFKTEMIFSGFSIIKHKLIAANIGVLVNNATVLGDIIINVNHTDFSLYYYVDNKANKTYKTIYQTVARAESSNIKKDFLKLN